MKKISVLFSIFFIILIKSQTVSDYKYVKLPSEFTDFKNSKSYGLRNTVEKSLKIKKYSILEESKTNWPSEALQNPCAVLSADLSDDSNMFKNKVILTFKDCNNQVVLSQKGNSSIKDYEAGLQEAVKSALNTVSVSNPDLKKLADSKVGENKAVETKVVEDIKSTETKSETTVAQKFNNGKLNLQKIQIDNSQFILVDGNSSVPFATFKSTTKADVFRVKLSSGESTIGYYENGNIVIELPKTNGEFSKEIYKAN